MAPSPTSPSTSSSFSLALSLGKAIQQSLDAFDYDNALMLSEFMMNLVPEFEESMYFLAQSLYLLHRPKLAIMVLTSKESKHLWNSYLLARIYLDLEMYKEAELALLEEAPVLSIPKLLQEDLTQENLGIVPLPHPSAMWKLLGSIYRKTHRHELAILCFEQALKLNPLQWTAYEALCQLGSKTSPDLYFLNTSSSKPSPRPSSKRKKLDPVSNSSSSSSLSPSSVDNVHFLYPYANTFYYLHQSQFSEAFQAVKSLPQEHSFTLLYTAILYFEQRKYPSSQSMFETLYHRFPWILRGIDMYSTCLWFLKQDNILARLATQLKLVAPLSPETWITLGNYASVQRLHHNAITCFQRASQLTKHAHYAYTLLGHEYLVVKDLDNAIQAFRQAIHLHPRSYNAWHGLGTCYQETDQLDFALYHYQKAAELHPSSVLVSYIGNVYHAKGDEASAIRMYNKAIQLDPDNPVPQFAKATSLSRLNRYREAMTILLDLTRKYPLELNVLCLLGWLYFKLGQKNDALRTFMDAYGSCYGDKIPLFLREVVSEIQSPLSHSKSGHYHHSNSSSSSSSDGGGSTAVGRGSDWNDLETLLNAIGINDGTKLRQ